MNHLEIDIPWSDVDGLVCAGIGEAESHALAVAARVGARARAAELMAALQLVPRPPPARPS